MDVGMWGLGFDLVLTWYTPRRALDSWTRAERNKRFVNPGLLTEAGSFSDLVSRTRAEGKDVLFEAKVELIVVGEM